MYDIAQLDVRTKRRLGKRLRQMAKTGKLPNETLYSSSGTIATTIVEGLMPFRPNYRRDRLERDRAARSRSDEKQNERNEKSAKRKAERTEAEGPPNEEEAQHAGDSSAKSVPTN
jgi:hypothetical protein